MYRFVTSAERRDRPRNALQKERENVAFLPAADSNAMWRRSVFVHNLLSCSSGILHMSSNSRGRVAPSLMRGVSHVMKSTDSTLAESTGFGGTYALEVGEGAAIRRFLEKPTKVQGLPDDPGMALASMGNYVFNAAALRAVVTADAQDESSDHDIGGDLIPRMVAAGVAGVYDFTRNVVPGETDRDRHYWRDVGTLDSYFDAHMDLVAPHPVFNLYNDSWPVYTMSRMLPPAKLVKDGEFGEPRISDSVLCAGAIVSGAQVRRTVVAPGVRIEAGALVERSILMDDVYIGSEAVVRNAIIDKNVIVPASYQIGVDLRRDRERFSVTDSGIVTIAKGQVI